MMNVGVIDYGVGNLGSMMQALEGLRVRPTLITRATDMLAMDSLILPGVGNFSECMRVLIEGSWDQALQDEVQGGGKPLLGVCVGMQLLASWGSEGADYDAPNGTPGLGFIAGRVVHLESLGCDMRTPHIGWNGVTPARTHGGLFDGIPVETDLYFVHSYAFVPEDPTDVLATTDYGIPITAAVRRGNICQNGGQLAD